MRPIRLELQGFTVFRDPTELDLRQADLFALTGPTGSGKSSLIDAICFALYGSVPRYDDRRLVAPVVTRGKSEARVRFEFSVGEATYTAVRVVRLTQRGGATTKEARLEREGRVLAGDAAAVTAEVEGLLGLDFEHFTKCVVLPQGEFAGFLHDTPAGRQELLRRLLDLEVFRRMAQRANQRAAEAEGRVSVLDRLLEEMGEATPEALERAKERLEHLRRLAAKVSEHREALAEMDGRAAETAAGIAELETGVESVQSLAVPEGAETLAALVASARAALRSAQAAAEEARELVRGTEELRASQPDAELLRTLRETIRQRDRLREEIRSESAVVEEAIRAAEQAADQARQARERHEAALERRREFERSHAAHALATGLEPGRPCPVCLRPIEEVPDLETPSELGEGEREVGEAARVREARERGAAEAALARTAIEARRADRSGRLEEFEQALAGEPALHEVEETLEAVVTSEEAVSDARRRERQATAGLAEAESELEKIGAALRELGSGFHRARDAVVGLGPPPVGDDPIDNWRRLAAWAQVRLSELRGRLDERRAQASALENRRREMLGEMSRLIRAADVRVEGDRFAEAVAEALAEARLEVRRLEEAIEEAGRLRKERDEKRSDGRVARDLARLLGARGFEQWLVEEAVGALLTAANRIIDQLSSGSFSLVVAEEGAAFEVVDHLNADERRPARTLSGGETFLASLALALSLADELAAMSVHGTARLESIFLDEGFGTLDAETLETVAAVIHELGAGGRAVGVVTHVRELAEQMPIRFEVRKGARTAEVCRFPPIEAA